MSKWKNLGQIFLVGLVLVVIGLGVMTLLNRKSFVEGFETYSGYGFEIKYPKTGKLVDSPSSLEGNDYWHGSVKVTDEDSFELKIYWTINGYSSATNFLDALLETEKSNRSELTWSQSEVDTTTQYRINFRRIISYINGNSENGVLGSFRTSEGRLFALYYLDLKSEEQVKRAFLELVGSFHSTPPETPRVLEAYWPTNGWRYASAFEVGLDQSILDEMIDDIKSSGKAVDSVTIVKDGYIVIDEYFRGHSSEELHVVYSCTKSVVSTLIGIAIDEGLITGVDAKMLDFFQGQTAANMNAWKSELTLRDMLMMSAGFDARDSWLYQWEGLEKMQARDDWAQYVLDLPVVWEPGSRFEYTNGVSHLLSCIITKVTGEPADMYAQEKIFTPLGISEFVWQRDPMDNSWGYSGLRLKPHDMAKIGYLFLMEGRWEGRTLVSSEWVREATVKRLKGNLKDGYGYQWWVDDDGYYLALGYMGQFIFVFPAQNMVAVLTSSSVETFDYSVKLPEMFILPAVL